ncbi:SRPBCC family protein [Ilumatobacter sp.]|uniref:SRPBCC family protein n=1 Tax=Ilumatobacter sp. TaxID=1967498 RepID=UPI003C56B9BA
MILADATIEIAARRDAVFDLFTTKRGLEQWMAREAWVDLRPGGAWRWTHDNAATSSGEYLEIEPPDRLAFTYGWESGEFADIGPGTTTVEVTFEEIDAGTRVTVTHSGLPPANVARHAAGWTHFLHVLSDVCAGTAAPAVNLPEPT